MFFVKFKNCFFIMFIVSALPLLAPYYLGDKEADPIDEQKYPELAKFIQRYGCPDAAENQAREEHLANGNYYRYGNKFYCKHGKGFDFDKAFHRIINARRLQNYINEKGLDRIGVPYKCWFKNRYDIASQGVPYLENDKKVSLQEVQQLAQLAEETGFSDWARDLKTSEKLGSSDANVRRDETGKFIFIDTEDRSFATGWKNDSLIYRISLLQLFLRRSMDLEAEQWLENRLTQLKNSPEGQEKPINHLLGNSKHDDPDINFEQVKREFYALKKDEQKKWEDEVDARMKESKLQES